MGVRSRSAARRRVDGCRLRRRCQVADGGDGARLDVCDRHSAEHARLVARHGAGERPGAPKKGRRGESRIKSAKEIALALPAKAWRFIRWREGTCEWLSSCFARVRIRVAHQHAGPDIPHEEWLLVEWPKGELEPTKYWLSTLPESIAFNRLVDAAKLRWRIERDYQELKQEVGLGHYEGRGWRGFHHHATLSIAAYGFLVSERETIPPSTPRRQTLGPQLALPQGYQPRGSPATA